jgi:hypothetical protein
MIDKVRAAQAGTLGLYLYGQSPMDRACLRALGLGHRSFAEIVANAPDDRAVLAAIAARDSQALDRGRAWGARLPRRHRAFLAVLDIDDGYASASGMRSVVNVSANAISWLAKRLWPYRA